MRVTSPRRSTRRRDLELLYLPRFQGSEDITVWGSNTKATVLGCVLREPRCNSMTAALEMSARWQRLLPETWPCLISPRPPPPFPDPYCEYYIIHRVFLAPAVTTYRTAWKHLLPSRHTDRESILRRQVLQVVLHPSIFRAAHLRSRRAWKRLPPRYTEWAASST